MGADQSQKPRLVVVSNRLPFTLLRKEKRWKFERSVGGLASGLSTYLQGNSTYRTDYLWVGWPGTSVGQEDQEEEVRSIALSEFRSYPVFLSESVMESFYHGFCNSTIWPLFHDFPSLARFREDYWARYEEVNKTFLSSTLDIIQPNDVVWVHDYHLMLLPKLLREKFPDLPIGFFLHTPFPPLEVFQLLPRRWREEILNGLLGADLVGFHTHDYTQAFLRCVLRILGHEHNMGRISAEERMVKADTFPMGIDFKGISELSQSFQTRVEMDELRNKLGNLRVVLSVDRLDYTKGVINRLLAYEIFLERNPQLAGKVVLVLTVSPSRSGVERYQQLKKQIDEFVGRINGRFGSVGWTPVLYQYRFLSPESLLAAYGISDVALVTPMKDGMNLVAKEYLAARDDETGVLVMSEMAGAAMELGEALIVNPNDTMEIADALKTALEMPRSEQVRRNRVMRRRLERYDVFRWGDEFLQELAAVKGEQKKLATNLLGPGLREKLLSDFKDARKRLVLLDYDGTLVELFRDPQQASPSGDLLGLLQRLLHRPSTRVVIVSGRDRNTLTDWFDGTGVGLVAEHGTWIMDDAHWTLAGSTTGDWKSQLLPILAMYADRLPGAFVEEKDHSLAWHYRKADPEQSRVRATELTDALMGLTANLDVQVITGNKVVEVRKTGVNKGSAALHFLSKDMYDFILAVGDDSTDEELFKALPDNAYSIRVGLTQSHARYNLQRPSNVIELLRQLAE